VKRTLLLLVLAIFAALLILAAALLATLMVILAVLYALILIVRLSRVLLDEVLELIGGVPVNVIKQCRRIAKAWRAKR
jgi:hypothetical protein